MTKKIKLLLQKLKLSNVDIHKKVYVTVTTLEKDKRKCKISKLRYNQILFIFIFRLLLWLKINKKVNNVCYHVIAYIHSHKKLFPCISVANKATFPSASLIPGWKLGWIGEKISSSAFCLAKISQIYPKTFSFPTN